MCSNLTKKTKQQPEWQIGLCNGLKTRQGGFNSHFWYKQLLTAKHYKFVVTSQKNKPKTKNKQVTIPKNQKQTANNKRKKTKTQ